MHQNCYPNTVNFVKLQNIAIVARVCFLPDYLKYLNITLSNEHIKRNVLHN